MKATKQATATASKSAKSEPKTEPRDPKPNACVCGCGARVHHLFAQGHDQRVRGMMQRHAEDAKANPLPKTLAAAIKAGLVKLAAHTKPNMAVLA